MSSTPQASSVPKPVRGMGPAIIIVLIIVGAILGYYQLVYYPSVAVETTSTTSVSQVTPFLANITILVGAGGTTTPRSQTFSPNVATVYLGYNSTVVWTNADSALHTITANSTDQSTDPAFYSWSDPTGFNNIEPNGVPGDSLNFTFTVAGTYGYYCKYHANMVGTLIVKPAPTNLTVSTSSSNHSKTLTSSTTAILGGVVPYMFSVETAFATSLATLTGSGTAP